MRVANVAGRLVLLVDGLAVDVEKASDGEFGADPQAIFGRWDAFTPLGWGRDIAGWRPL